MRIRFVLLPLLVACGATPHAVRYPAAAHGDVVEHHGDLTVRDPYRWLEAMDSPETRAWLAEENRLTDTHSARIFVFARTRRWAIVAGAIRNARAISSVVRPPSVRSVNATWASSASAG